MGACFGVALTLVIFTASDLFTGHIMLMTIGLALDPTELAALGRNWLLSWIGNLGAGVG